MGRVLEIMWMTIDTFWQGVREWLETLASSPEAWIGPGLGALIAILVLLLLLLLLPRSGRATRDQKRPELLISRGEVRFHDESSLTELAIHVSNLGDGVVQLLEVAISSDLMPRPETVELSMLVPRDRSVDISVDVEELQGDTGILHLYFYTPQTRNRAFRLRANLVWEPWNARYKVDPLGQRIEPARRLASSKLQRRQREEWRRRQRQDDMRPAAEPVVEPEIIDDASDERVRERERLDFPSDF